VGWSPAGGKGWWSLKGEFGYWMTSILPPVFGSGKGEIIASGSRIGVLSLWGGTKNPPGFGGFG